MEQQHSYTTDEIINWFNQWGKLFNISHASKLHIPIHINSAPRNIPNRNVCTCTSKDVHKHILMYKNSGWWLPFDGREGAQGALGIPAVFYFLILVVVTWVFVLWSFIELYILFCELFCICIIFHNLKNIFLKTLSLERKRTWQDVNNFCN